MLFNGMLNMLDNVLYDLLDFRLVIIVTQVTWLIWLNQLSMSYCHDPGEKGDCIFQDENIHWPSKQVIGHRSEEEEEEEEEPTAPH